METLLLCASTFDIVMIKKLFCFSLWLIDLVYMLFSSATSDAVVFVFLIQRNASNHYILICTPVYPVSSY